MHDYVGEVVVVESGSAQPRIGELEGEWPDQVEFAAGCRCEPDRVAGVRRNARLDERNSKHNCPPFHDHWSNMYASRRRVVAIFAQSAQMLGPWAASEGLP